MLHAQVRRQGFDDEARRARNQRDDVSLTQVIAYPRSRLGVDLGPDLLFEKILGLGD